MTANTTALSKQPNPDTAEHNAFFPSPYSLSLYIPEKTDFAGLKFAKPYQEGKYKVLMIASDERYLLMGNGKFFSTGNHPVETLLPMHHLDQAGFEIEVATLSGNPVKLEMWAFPSKDETVKAVYDKYLPKFKQPLKLSEVLAKQLGEDSPYLGVFIPGGHAAMHAIPFSDEVKQVLKWAVASDKYVISLCHGPAGLIAAAHHEPDQDFIFKGYKICVFPDSLDLGANVDIGYIPGPMPWLLGEKLKSLGMEILNESISGQCYQDRKLITGDSPLAANQLGIIAADALLKEVAS